MVILFTVRFPFFLGHILIQEENDITWEWIHAIYVGMSKHRDKKHIQKAGCKAFYRLLQLKYDVLSWVGEDPTVEKQ